MFFECCYCPCINSILFPYIKIKYFQSVLRILDDQTFFQYLQTSTHFIWFVYLFDNQMFKSRDCGCAILKIFLEHIQKRCNHAYYSLNYGVTLTYHLKGQWFTISVKHPTLTYLKAFKLYI